MLTVNNESVDFDVTKLELRASPFFKGYEASLAYSKKLTIETAPLIHRVKQDLDSALHGELPFKHLYKRRLLSKPNIHEIFSSNRHLSQLAHSFFALKNAIISDMRDCKFNGSVTNTFFNRLLAELSRNIIFNSYNRLLASRGKTLPSDTLFGKNGYALDMISRDGMMYLSHILSHEIRALQEIDTGGQHQRNQYDRAKRFMDRPGTRRVFNEVKRTLIDNGLDQLVLGAAGCPMALDSFTLHISRSDDKHIYQTFGDASNISPILNMHLDPKWGHIKIILYLDDCDQADGPFSFVPGSHLIEHCPLALNAAKANSVSNYLQTRQEREEFAALPKALRSSALFGTILTDESKIAGQLRALEQSFTGPAGTCIIFNPYLGFHRGGQTAAGRQRIALQIIFRPQQICEVVNGF